MGLTQGTGQKGIRPEGAAESNSLCRTLNEIPAIVPALSGPVVDVIFLGLKTQAESLHPFGINRGRAGAHPYRFFGLAFSHI
jgi:hypothetical protein